ncbi:MAG: glycosyltransferase family 4 protein [Syntrophomonadaceae bacterium]|nr:glycosyltransferase family 4 protein [Syntrophomonadaceae bacterium]
MSVSVRVLFLLAGDIKRASSRYRVIQYLPYFKQIVPDVEWSARPSAALIQRARQVDLVFVQKGLLYPDFLKDIRMAGPRLVYDFDDSIFADHDFALKVNEKSYEYRRFQASLQQYHLILAGNNYLGSIAGGFHPRVKIVPTTVDVLTYPVKKKVVPAGKITIGWIGHSSNQAYLKLLIDPLKRLRSVSANWSFRIISDLPCASPGLPAEFRRWSLDYLQELQQIDIGVMPLLDNVAGKGKCACKALQYMAAGIPAVVSPVGLNREVIKEGVTGFFARDAKEWYVKLMRLSINSSLRSKTGEAGRIFVHSHYAAHTWAERLEKILVEEAGLRSS